MHHPLVGAGAARCAEGGLRGDRGGRGDEGDVPRPLPRLAVLRRVAAGHERGVRGLAGAQLELGHRLLHGPRGRAVHALPLLLRVPHAGRHHGEHADLYRLPHAALQGGHLRRRGHRPRLPSGGAPHRERQDQAQHSAPDHVQDALRGVSHVPGPCRPSPRSPHRQVQRALPLPFRQHDFGQNALLEIHDQDGAGRDGGDLPHGAALRPQQRGLLPRARRRAVLRRRHLFPRCNFLPAPHEGHRRLLPQAQGERGQAAARLHPDQGRRVRAAGYAVRAAHLLDRHAVARPGGGWAGPLHGGLFAPRPGAHLLRLGDGRERAQAHPLLPVLFDAAPDGARLAARTRRRAAASRPARTGALASARAHGAHRAAPRAGSPRLARLSAYCLSAERRLRGGGAEVPSA
mmetsp:Transcript_678/g.1893  ORF Transcript_678/g.1893 Transcript_678/m.1893 type:complete len:403 (+) Transcript_678:649-1857(+)